MEEYTCQSHNEDFFDALTSAKGFETVNENLYVSILFDILLYRYPELTKRIYSLLVRYFLRKRTTIAALKKLQVLESNKSEKILTDVKRLHGQLINIKAETSLWITVSSEYGSKTKRRVTEIFSEFEDLCMSKEE